MTLTLPRLTGLVALIVAVGLGGYFLGHRSGGAEWHTVTIQRAAVASDDAGARLLTVRTDGWSYGMKDSVTKWLDAEGSQHAGGWPSCLEPAHPADGPEANPGQVTFRFASVEAKTGVIDYRPVVLVDCRS